MPEKFYLGVKMHINVRFTTMVHSHSTLLHNPVERTKITLSSHSSQVQFSQISALLPNTLLNLLTQVM